MFCECDCVLQKLYWPGINCASGYSRVHKFLPLSRLSLRTVVIWICFLVLYINVSIYSDAICLFRFCISSCLIFMYIQLIFLFTNYQFSKYYLLIYFYSYLLYISYLRIMCITLTLDIIRYFLAFYLCNSNTHTHVHTHTHLHTDVYIYIYIYIYI